MPYVASGSNVANVALQDYLREFWCVVLVDLQECGRSSFYLSRDNVFIIMNLF